MTINYRMLLDKEPGAGGGSGDPGTGTSASASDSGDPGSGNVDEGEAERLRKDLKSVRSEASTYRRKLRELEDKIDGVDFDEYSLLKKSESERKAQSLEAKGKYEELYAENKKRSEAQIAKINETSSMWKNRYTAQVVDNVLLSAATSKAINPSEVVTLIRSNYKFNVTDGGDVEILGKKGEVILNDEGHAVAPSHVMESFLAERTYLCKPIGGGAGSRSGSGPGRSGTARQEPLHGVARIQNALKDRMNK